MVTRVDLLRPQNLIRRHGWYESTCGYGELLVRGGERVGLQLSQCDELSSVGVRPVQLSGYPPSMILQGSIAEKPDSQPTDPVEHFSARPLVDLAAAHRLVHERKDLRAQERRRSQAVF